MVVTVFFWPALPLGERVTVVVLVLVFVTVVWVPTVSPGMVLTEGSLGLTTL